MPGFQSVLNRVSLNSPMAFRRYSVTLASKTTSRKLRGNHRTFFKATGEDAQADMPTSGQFDELLKAMDKGFLNVVTELNAMKKETNAMKKDVNRGFAQSAKFFGHYNEKVAREYATRLFGEAYSQGLTAKSLFDLMEYAVGKPKAQWSKDAMNQASYFEKKMASALIDSKIPEKLLCCILRQAGHHTNHDESLSKILTASWALLKDSNNQALKHSVKRLTNFLEKKKRSRKTDASACVEEFTSEEGAGLMCLIAAANDDKYMCIESTSDGETNNIRFPPAVLDIDMQGKVSKTSKHGVFAIDFGEIKSSLDYSAGVEQLGERGKVVHHLLKTVWDLEGDPFEITGRLFVPEEAINQQQTEGVYKVDKYQAKLAEQKYNMVLELEVVKK